MADPGINLELLVDDGVTTTLDECILSDLVESMSDLESRLPRGSWSLALRITDDERIAAIHDQFFADPTPTDVISFPSGDDLREREGHLGDIVVSMTTAASNAAIYGHSTDREVAFLFLHGVLHVIGYDDAIPEERDDMLRRQTAILEAFERQRRFSL